MELKLQNLSHEYGGERILQGINLQIEGVSSVGIIGASGCGKSTLLRLMAGIERATEGEIYLNGLSPTEDREQLQQNIGYVFQKHNLFPHLTVRQNLALILEKIRGWDSVVAQEKITQVLQQLHLEQEGEKRPHEISGGQAQRASIARALVTDPAVLFLDEPTAALDPILTREVLAAVQQLKEQGRSFVFVTHEMDFLKKFADYIIFMKDGEIVEEGDTTIFDQPKTEELQTFLLH